MSITTITSKGQVTLPKEIRVKLHLDAGEKVDFRVDEENGTAIMVPLNKHADDVFGMLSRGRKIRHISAEGMNRKIRDRFRKEYS